MHYNSAYFRPQSLCFLYLVSLFPQIATLDTEITELVHILHCQKAKLKSLAYARCEKKFIREPYE